MRTAIAVTQIVVSILLVATILLQQRGTGLSTTFGGAGNVYRTKRGIEKGLFAATIVLASLFVAVAVASIILSA